MQDDERKESTDKEVNDENRIQAYFLTCQIIFKGG